MSCSQWVYIVSVLSWIVAWHCIGLQVYFDAVGYRFVPHALIGLCFVGFLDGVVAIAYLSSMSSTYHRFRGLRDQRLFGATRSFHEFLIATAILLACIGFGCLMAYMIGFAVFGCVGLSALIAALTALFILAGHSPSTRDPV